MKKIGLICLALVMALGSLGAAYAMWFDTITITGEVNTGSVDIQIESLSETYVYKVLSTRGIRFSPVPLNDPDLLLVASATCSSNDVMVPTDAEPVDESVHMIFDNIFPTPLEGPIVADVMLHYVGSIPAHVAYNDVIDPAIAPYIVQRWTLFKSTGEVEEDINPGDVQLHFCDRLYVEVFLDPVLLQIDGARAQLISGSFTKTLLVHQWNETP